MLAYAVKEKSDYLNEIFRESYLLVLFKNPIYRCRCFCSHDVPLDESDELN
tara:strand:+ start:649 stop:801 length:153 start_codon:yes stop_codon:yes gene_type:complete